jgi:hypothetical protein
MVPCESVGASDIHQAVFTKGFNPFREGLVPGAPSNEAIYEYWKGVIAQDKSDWSVCARCMATLSRYLIHAPRPTGTPYSDVRLDFAGAEEARREAERSASTGMPKEEKQASSDFKFSCPHCQQHILAPVELFGQIVDCPTCKKRIQLPEAQPNTPTPPAVRPSRVVKEHTIKPTRRPSSVTGYLLAIPLTLPVLFVLVLVTGRRGAGISWFVTAAGAITYGIIASAINRYRMRSFTETSGTSPVVLLPEPESVLKQETESAGARPRIVGQWIDGRFLLTKADLARIRQEPARFDNVLVCTTEPSGVSGSLGDRWYIVLARGSAIACSGDLSEIWTVDRNRLEPKEVSCGALTGSFRLRSTEGAKLVLQFDASILLCLLVWRSDNWQDYLKRAGETKPPGGLWKTPPQWALLVWSIDSEKDPNAWISFPLPYTSNREGLKQLCAKRADLLNVISAVGTPKAARWLQIAETGDRETIQAVLVEMSGGEARTALVVAVVCLLAGALLVWLTILARSLDAVVLGILAAIFLAVGWFKMDRYFVLRRLRESLSNITSAQIIDSKGGST